MYKEVALHIGRDYQRQRYVERSLKEIGIELRTTPSLLQAKEYLPSIYHRLVIIHYDTADPTHEIFNFCSYICSTFKHSVVVILMKKFKRDAEAKLFDCGVRDVVVGEQGSGSLLYRRLLAHLKHTKSGYHPKNTLRLKNTLVDFERREVWCNGTVRRLPGILFDLLKYFADNPGRIISRDELLKSHIWSDSICSSAEEGGKTFDVNIGKLRKIIELDPANPEILVSVRGVGWKLALECIEEFQNEN